MEEMEPPHKELAALPKSGEIYRALLAYSRDAILGVNRKGTIIFWNKGAEDAGETQRGLHKRTEGFLERKLRGNRDHRR
jgi:PAS domain-containing protein